MTVRKWETVQRPMTVSEVAKATGFCPSTIRKAVKQGGLVGHVPVGMKTMFFLPEDVNAWLTGGRRSA